VRGARAAAVAALALLGAAGCTDVTTEPLSAISTANVFNDPGAYRSALAKLYGTLALSGPGDTDGDIQGIDPGFGQYLRAYWNLQQLPTDETTLAWNDQSAGVQELNAQTWTTNNGTITGMYARLTLPIGPRRQLPARDHRRATLRPRRHDGPACRDHALPRRGALPPGAELLARDRPVRQRAVRFKNVKKKKTEESGGVGARVGGARPGRRGHPRQAGAQKQAEAASSY
jgi:hypothetical protein